MKWRHFYVSALLSCVFFLHAKAQQNPDKPFVKIDGEVKIPLTLYADDLARMKRVTATLKDHDGKGQTYTGVALQDIMQKAGVTMGNELRGANLAKYLLVKCADGYKVVFALAELDNAFTDRVIILADEIAGKPLPKDRGPFRLIVPSEKRPARSSYQVTEMVVKSASE